MRSGGTTVSGGGFNADGTRRATENPLGFRFKRESDSQGRRSTARFPLSTISWTGSSAFRTFCWASGGINVQIQSAAGPLDDCALDEGGSVTDVPANGGTADISSSEPAHATK